MRPQRRRKKKLIVAFHFQFSNQAAWKCEPCRRQGLAARRRCGWLGGRDELAQNGLAGRGKSVEGAPSFGAAPGGLCASDNKRVIVWARGAVTATTCPKSLTTAEMLRWMEEFFAWRMSGRGDLRKYPARTAEAFLALEQEMQSVESVGPQMNTDERG